MRCSLRFALAISVAALLCGPGSPVLSADEPAVQVSIDNPFFAFCSDIHDSEKRTLQQQAILLKELGFDGGGHVGLENVRERLQTLDEAGLKLFLVGFRFDLASDKRPYISQLRDVLPLLKGRDTALYVTIGGLPPADPSGEKAAVSILREIAEIARQSGVRVALYPHTGDWLVRVDHAVRVAQQVDRPNVGVMFNLCHWLRNEPDANLDSQLKSAMPHLFLVSINGAELAGRSDNNWNRLIQPLDQGDFNVHGLLKTLKELGYAGPVALMCYGIRGDARDHLLQSMSHWRKLTGRVKSQRILLPAGGKAGSLDGWQSYCQDGAEAKDTWRLDAEGVLHCTGVPLGYVYTEKDFDNFVLELDWRWPPGETPGKGGVLVRTTGPDQIWPKSLEAQINAGNAGDFWGLAGYQLDGPEDRLKSLDHPQFGKLTNVGKTSMAEKPAGQWNHYRIIADGQTVTLEINGQTVNRATGCDAAPGRILLTAEGSPIQYRNVRLRPLATPKSPR